MTLLTLPSDAAEYETMQGALAPEGHSLNAAAQRSGGLFLQGLLRLRMSGKERNEAELGSTHDLHQPRPHHSFLLTTVI